MDYTDITKIFTLSTLGFFIALIFTPILSNFLQKNRLGKQIRNSGNTPLYSKLHAKKAGTPTMGGVLVWGTAVFLASFFWIFDRIFNITEFHVLNFLTRKETLLPFGAFLGASVVGLIDDWLDVKKLGHDGRGLRFRLKIWLYLIVAGIGAWWFYFKLQFSVVHVPFFGNVDLGWLYIPFFILIVTGVSFAVDLTDGLDGLAGGTLMVALFSYGLIAFVQGKTNLAAMVAVVCGSLLAFLWFNVYPAKFFMGDTGSMGLGVLLAIISFLTNSVLLLPLIGFVFMSEALSTLLQIFWKKTFKKKLLLSTPVHHHFEVIGWPETKITMRFWIISAVTGIIGVIVYFLG